MSQIIAKVTNEVKKAQDLSWDDIAAFMVGDNKIETLGTGAFIAGTGLTGYGIVAGDDSAVVDGIVVGGAGLLARGLRTGYRIYKHFRPGTVPVACAVTHELIKEPAITQAQAEEQLSLVDAAKTSDATAEVLKKSAIELGLSADRWVQLSAKAKENHLNKPEAQLYNAVIKFAELQCQHA